MDIGSSYLPSDILAAFLYAQLENMDSITLRRKEIFDYYYNAMRPLENSGDIELPFVPEKAQGNNHLFYIILNDEKTRNDLMDYLKSKGILAVFHYIPLHLSPVGRSMGYKEGQFPVTESKSSCLLRLPFYYELTKKEQDEVIKLVKNFFGIK